MQQRTARASLNKLLFTGALLLTVTCGRASRSPAPKSPGLRAHVTSATLNTTSALASKMLQLDETLHWLEVWFEVRVAQYVHRPCLLTRLQLPSQKVLPALRQGKGLWREVGQSCSKDALHQARRLYLRALVLVSLQSPTAVQEQHGLLQEGTAVWEGQPIALTLLRQLEAVDLCHRLVCGLAMQGGGDEQRYKGAFAGTRRVTLAALHALQLAMEARQTQLTDVAEQRGWSLDREAAPTEASGSQAAYWSNGQPPSDEAALQAVHASLAQDLTHVRLGGRAAVLSFRRTEQCSRRLRPVMEGLHVSKSGGTSMCELARLAGRSNPGFNPYSNCKVVHGFKRSTATDITDC
jgi:hypothetical protein